MAANTSPIFELTVKNAGVEFTISDTTTKKTIYTGGTNGTRIDDIFISTNDTSAVNLSFFITTGGTDYYIGVVNVPIGSGYTTVARVSAMGTLSPAIGYLVLASGDVLKASCVATMTTAKVTDVVAMLGDF